MAVITICMFCILASQLGVGLQSWHSPTEFLVGVQRSAEGHTIWRPSLRALTAVSLHAVAGDAVWGLPLRADPRLWGPARRPPHRHLWGGRLHPPLEHAHPPLHLSPHLLNRPSVSCPCLVQCILLSRCAPWHLELLMCRHSSPAVSRMLCMLCTLCAARPSRRVSATEATDFCLDLQ